MSLSGDLADVFKKMKDAADGDNHTFADGIIKAVRTSLESGKTTSIYNGSCSFGTVAATVTGTGTAIDGSPGASAADDIYNAIKDMDDGDDQTWIDAVTDGISKLTTKAKCKESLAGTAIPPSPPPPTVPVSGTAEGTLKDPGKSALKAAIGAIPSAMGSSGDDSILASMLAAAVLAYFGACITDMAGQGGTSGLTGVGAMAGNS